jgi:muramoyltetrapeptide carboxypeptidase
MARRKILQTMAVGAASTLGLAAHHGAQAQPLASAAVSPTVLRPARLKPGDTIGLISPSRATYERGRFTVAIENLQTLGFKVKEGRHLRARNGHFAGTDAQRAEDLNTMFADPEVNGIVAMTGGSGATRILSLLDYELIRRQPKCLVGYSDVTALLNGIHARTGLVCFHGPMGASEWNDFSVGYFRRVLMEAAPVQFSNPAEKGSGLVQSLSGRTQTVRGGRARGKLLGSNLSVLTTLLGTPYAPDFRGSILFLEDVNEYIYRVDRMLAHLRLAGVLDHLAGVVLGQFTDCKPGDDYGTLPLDDVFDDYFRPLNIPVFSGSMFGHVKLKFTLPLGLDAEMDADRGSITLLQPAVV